VSPGLVGALISLGVASDRARAYEARLARHTLVIVAAQARQVEAQDILREFAAVAVDELVPAQEYSGATAPAEHAEFGTEQP
jgi:hypothetical protein